MLQNSNGCTLNIEIFPVSSGGLPVLFLCVFLLLCAHEATVAASGRPPDQLHMLMGVSVGWHWQGLEGNSGSPRTLLMELVHSRLLWQASHVTAQQLHLHLSHLTARTE